MRPVSPPSVPAEVQRFFERPLSGARHWVELPGGRTNRIWHLRDEQGDRVLKLFDPGRANLLFPNDPEAEARVLVALQGHGLAPELFATFETETGPCLIYDFLPGEPLARVDPATIRALAQIHAMRPNIALRHVEDTPEALLRMGMAFLADMPSEQADELIERIPEMKEIAPGPAVLLHGDPVPANVIADGETRRFIDWQCPGCGDATYDLAIALSPAMHHVYGREVLAPDCAEAALLAYPDPDVITRYRALAPYYHWRMAAYCAWKAAEGEEIYAEAGGLELSWLS